MNRLVLFFIVLLCLTSCGAGKKVSQELQAESRVESYDSVALASRIDRMVKDALTENINSLTHQDIQIERTIYSAPDSTGQQYVVEEESINIKSTTEENISIVKPDAYLRGLKYDNEKKRRNDDRSENRGGGKRGVIVTILLLSLLSAAIVWGVWQWRGGITNNDVDVNYPTATIAPDTLLREDRDTLHRDTAAVESLDDISKDVSPSNSYLNPKFNKN